jgi:hypothetical protein
MQTRGAPIDTITGGIWYPFAPRAEDVRLADARALAYQARYLGHAGVDYSPIQHMALVARWLVGQGADGATVREGLGHDIHEAWPPGDVPAPCKRGDEPEAVLLRAWETRVERVVKPVFGLPVEMSNAVKIADRVLFATEVRDLNPAWHGELDWGPPLEPWSEFIDPWPAARAWSVWLEMWETFS